MNNSDSIQPDYFLDALRTGGSFSRDFKTCHGHSDKLPAASDRILDELPPVYGSLELRPMTGGDLVRVRLRWHTNEWINSGIGEDGTERPLSRKLTAAGKAFAAVKKYESRYPGIEIDWDNGLERRTLPFKERLAEAERSASAAGSLFRPIAQTKALPADVHKAAGVRADGIFHAFMEVPWRYQLGRCHRCFRYFVLKIKPRETYLRGMHCPDCKNIASAETSAKTRRVAHSEKLLSLAVKASRLYKPSSEFGERNKWIAKQVNFWLEKGEKKIQQNWVTRHEKEIKAEAKKRTDTKPARESHLATR